MKTETIGKIPELYPTENDEFLLTKRLEEKHHKLLLGLKQQYGKPIKPIKDARKAWKDTEENFSEALLKMRAE